jgi:hypothetical protein
MAGSAMVNTSLLDAVEKSSLRIFFCLRKNPHAIIINKGMTALKLKKRLVKIEPDNSLPHVAVNSGYNLHYTIELMIEKSF